jgi:putative transposase
LSTPDSGVILHIVLRSNDPQGQIPTDTASLFFSELTSTLCQSSITVYKIGGVSDHIHIACALPCRMSQDELVELIKKISSKWLNEQAFVERQFSWQAGYGAFSIGNSQLEMLTQYIEQQQEYHEDVTFEAEYQQFLELYELND